MNVVIELSNEKIELLKDVLRYGYRSNIFYEDRKAIDEIIQIFSHQKINRKRGKIET